MAESTGELYCWGHAVGSPAIPDVQLAIRGKRMRSLAVSGKRVAAITDDPDGRISWFPRYIGWKARVKVPGGGNGAEDEVPQTNSPVASAGEKTEEESVAEALSEQMGKSRPSHIALGKDHVLVASDDGSVYSWGRGEEGQLGLPHAVGSVLPAEVKTLSARGVVVVAAGRAHSAAITHDGGLYCWGSNAYGQLGLGKGMPWTTVLVPRFVNAFLGVPVVYVSCGHNFTACVTAAGEVWTWGEGGCGQLGIGSVVTKSDRPVLAAGVDLPLSARGQNAVSLGGKADEEKAEGANAVDEPPRGAGFATVSCGWGHCLAVARDTGDIFAWGLNSHGQLGLGDTAKRLSPTLINATDEKNNTVAFDDVAAGDNNSVALARNSGEMWAWGSRGRCHVELKEEKPGKGGEHELRPRQVGARAGAGFGVGFIACGSECTAAFAPTRVRKIVPAAGPTDGGSEISIMVDGVWASDKILVKFTAILSEEEKEEVEEEDCVEIEAGTYNPETGAVVCQTPPWPLDESVIVEISVNGFDFTSNSVTYTFYNPPTVHGAWPPYGFMDVPTPITVYGKSIVSSTDLAVRFRSTTADRGDAAADGDNDDNGDFVSVIVPARYMGKGQVRCETPVIDSSQGFLECAVDVAINGIDFTDAGVIFTFHGFQPISCTPCCGPRKGGTEIAIPLSSDAGEIDEDGLRMKIDFGGTRAVECKAKARNGKLSFKTPKMDGSQRKPKFPSFEYTPVEDDSAVSEGAGSKKEESLIVEDPPPEPVVESLPWPKGTGFLEGKICVSVDGGITYRELPFVFTAYKSDPTTLMLADSVADTQGGADFRILDKSLAALEASKSDPGSNEESEKKEEKEDSENSGEGGGDDETAVSAEASGESGEWSGPSLKEPSSTELGPKDPWVFSSSEMRVRFRGSSGSAAANDDEDAEEAVFSINVDVPAVFDGEGTISCSVPALEATNVWIAAVKEKNARTGDDDDAEEQDEEEKPAMPPRPVNFEAQVSLALDGTNFENIGAVMMVTPPLVTGIIGSGPGESFVPGVEARLVGSGFGDEGTSIHVEVSHVLSGTDYVLTGVVEAVEGEEQPQSVVFTLPEEMNSHLVEGDEVSCKCNAEASIDGGKKFTSWQTTFTANPMPEEE